MSTLQQERRRAPSWLKNVLNLDEQLTKSFVIWGNSWSPLYSLRLHYKALEITCHGIPWLAFWTIFTWLFNIPHLIQLQINMLFALIFDILIVAICKSYFRRRRPIGNVDDAFAEIGPDKFSFPSGHVSRATMVAVIFTYIWPIWFIFYPPLITWVTALAISRVLMERHYLLDVIGGVVLGLVEGLVLSILWLSGDTATWLLNYLSNDKLNGDL